MSNIEQFAPAQFTEGFVDHNNNTEGPPMNGGAGGPGGPANPNFVPVTHIESNEQVADHKLFTHTGGSPPPMTDAEMENQKATDAAIETNALNSIDKTQTDFGNQQNGGNTDNANADAADAAAAHTAEHATDATANAHKGGMLTGNEQAGGNPVTQQSQHELGREAGMTNAKNGVNPQYTGANVDNMQKEVMEMEMEGGNIDQADMTEAQNKLQFGRGYIDGYGQQDSTAATQEANTRTEAAAAALRNEAAKLEEEINNANAPVQTGGDGYRLGVAQEMVGGQAVVNGYDNEQHVCGGYGEELAPQNGGGSPFNFITDPDTNQSLSIFSGAGKALLKRYVKAYKSMQSGGAALLDGVDAKAQGALYDGVQNAGAEALPGACGVTYDAAGPEWAHTQVGGGKRRKCGCKMSCKSCKKNKCGNKSPRDCNC